MTIRWESIERRACLLGAAVLATLGLGGAPVKAQTPGVHLDIPATYLPVQGPGLAGLHLRIDPTDWSISAEQLSGGRTHSSDMGWSYILLVDLNRDGRDDLCGLYGFGRYSHSSHAFLCVLNQPNGGFGGTPMQVDAFNGPADPSIHSTITAVDLDGTGKPYLCGRTMEGVKCQGFFRDHFDPPVLVHPMFSDANYWNQWQYYSTIGFAKLGGKLAICGRGTAGVLCYQESEWPGPTGELFASAALTQTQFSDGAGWSTPDYFLTLRYVDINGDGHSDICARGIAGIVCSVFRPGPPTPHFAPVELWTTQFSDAYGWRDAHYMTSIRFVDVSGDRAQDVCGRGSAGLYCGVSGSVSPGSPATSLLPPLNGAGTLLQSQVSDANGWGSPFDFPIDYQIAALHFVDFNGDGRNDFCAMGPVPNGARPEYPLTFLCAPNTGAPGAAAFGPLVLRTQGIRLDNFAGFLSGRLVVGRLYSGSNAGKIGFCWNDSYTGNVACSLPWN